MTTTPADGGHSASFVRSKLASILAIAPLGVWTFFHIWDQLSVFKSGAEWQKDVTGHQHPVALTLTTVVVLAPLLLHTLWGLGRLRTSRPNYGKYNYFENLKYVLQRVSAIGVLGFLIAHIWKAFLQPRLIEHQPETFQDLAAHMAHHLPTLLVYVLGTLGVAYHLGNGLFSFAWSWGIATSRRSLRGFQIASIILFVVLLAMSWGAIAGLYSAGTTLAVPMD